MTVRLTEEQAKLTGAIAKNPQRYRKKAPKSKYSIGNPPDHLREGAKAVWFELEEYAPPGVMAGADRASFELLCKLMDESRNPPLKGFSPGNLAQLVRLLSLFGFTPVDRMRLAVEPEKEVKEEDDFTNF